MPDHIFTGFGFGPIQVGLFVKVVYSSGEIGLKVESARTVAL
jgi:hypothetical protein